MKYKGLIVGIVIVIGLSLAFNFFENISIGSPSNSNGDQLLIIEDSVYDKLTNNEIKHLQEFAQKALNAADGNTTIYSPHAKFLDNDALLIYMLFVNNSGETVTGLKNIDTKMIAGNNQIIAEALFKSVKNVPPIANKSCFLFALVFHPDAIKIPDADLTSYITQVYFDYDT